MTDPFPSLEALEGAHNFPGNYVVKVFGRQEDAFIESVHARTMHVLDDQERYTLEIRPSSRGTYCVAHVEVFVDSAEEVQALYASLAQTEGLKTLL